MKLKSTLSVSETFNVSGTSVIGIEGSLLDTFNVLRYVPASSSAVLTFSITSADSPAGMVSSVGL